MSKEFLWWKVETLDDFKRSGSFEDVKKDIMTLFVHVGQHASNWEELYNQTQTHRYLLSRGVVPNDGFYFRPDLQYALVNQKKDIGSKMFRSEDERSFKKEWREFDLHVHPDRISSLDISEELKKHIVELRNTQFDKVKKAKKTKERKLKAKARRLPSKEKSLKNSDLENQEEKK